MSKETIADIVREMREMVENVTDSEGFRPAWAVYFEGFAERIEDAYERRLIASMDFLADKCAKVKSECERENAVLKAALKPVMEVHLNDGGTTPLSDSICAVAEAQRIMKKEGAK